MLPKIFNRRKNRIAADAYHHRLPPELWLQILNRLSVVDIPAVTLTCGFLRLLAQPFLFHSLLTHPFLGALSYRRIKPGVYSKRIAQRLNFFTSSLIAPAIEECLISPYPPGYYSFKCKDTALEHVVDAIFESLARFPNIKKLACYFITLTPKQLAILGELRLETLELAQPRGSFNLLTPGKLSTGRRPVYKQVTLNTPPQLTHPGHIQWISTGYVHTDTILSFIITTKLPLCCLTALDIYVNTAMFLKLIPALSQCPALEHICLRYSSVRDNSPLSFLPLPLGILPALTSYQGPCVYVPVFAQSCPLRQVKLWSYDGTTHFYHPLALAPTIVQLSTEVESLDIAVTDVTPSLFLAIYTAFPSLRSLVINADPFYRPPLLSSGAVCDVLDAVELPHSLESLCIGVVLHDDPQEALLQALHIITPFARTCPASRAAVLYFGHYPSSCQHFSWRRGSLSRSRGITDPSPVVAEVEWGQDIPPRYFRRPKQFIWEGP